MYQRWSNKFVKNNQFQDLKLLYKGNIRYNRTPLLLWKHTCKIHKKMPFLCIPHFTLFIHYLHDSMNAIASIHQKILDRFIQIRQREPLFYFAPRKINNKNRLDEGYWFLGNERYVHISFWNGVDWKQKIHNIGFVVWDDKRFAIELVAQDNAAKRPLMMAIIAAIPGFEKDPNKFKWYKHFEGTDYLAGLKNFIQTSKPIIDRLVTQYSGNGITAINDAYAKKYMERVMDLRGQQISYGAEHKVTRITWNTFRWQRPSGPAGKSSNDVAYESKSGYGHEEWLLDKSKIVDGYHYGFIQSLNIRTDRHIDNQYNITLFTTNNEGDFYQVGNISKAECIDEEISEEIFALYKKKGWLGAMERDIIAAGADLEKFRQTPANIFFNVRFRFENTTILDELEKIDPQDVNITTRHFKLLPKRTSELKREKVQLKDIEEDDDTDPCKRKNTAKRTKTYNVDCEYDPYHDLLQNDLFDLLKTGIDGYSTPRLEKSFVDLRAKKDNEWHFFEIKTDAPRLCIRKALGQIMEYAFFPDLEHAKRLIIIGDTDPDERVQVYLKKIRKDFKIPVFYRSFDRHEKKLSKEY